jgi:hypothetical protein
MRFVVATTLIIFTSLSAHGQDRLVTEVQLRAMNLDTFVKKANSKEVEARRSEPINPFAEDKLEELWASPELKSMPDDAHTKSAQEQADAILDALFPADVVQPPQKAAEFFVVPEGQEIDEPNLADPDEAAILANRILLALSPAEEEKMHLEGDGGAQESTT